MQKILDTINKNWQCIFTNVLISFIFGFFIIPFFLNLTFVIEIVQNQPYISIIIFLSVALLVLFILSYRNLLQLRMRLMNNYRLKEPPFTVVDNLFICFLILLISYFINFFINYRNNNIDFLLFKKASISVIGGLFFIFSLILALVSISPKEVSQGRQKKRAKPKKSALLSDEPISHINKDLLGRKLFIKNVVKQIIEFPYFDAFVVGLYGKWGEGKTSTLKLLQNELQDKENSEKFVLVEFDPWIFRNDEAMLKNFFDCIWKNINKKYFFPHLKKVIRKYQYLLNAVFKHFALDLNFKFPEECIESIKNKIETCIQKLDKKIIIFIDDIDRLIPKEILLIFKVVKIAANFQNTIFILSFDQVKVSELLDTKSGVDPEFLEKIVQQQINLPRIEQADIDKFLVNSDSSANYKCEIEKLFDDLIIEEEKIDNFIKKFRFDYMLSINRFFRTLRHAKRYINEIRASLPAVEKEVNLYDFFVLGIIRLFFSELCDDIFENWWYFVNSRNENEFFYLSPLAHLEEDDVKKRIVKHCDDIINKKEDENERELFKELLCRLFPKVDTAYGKNLYKSDNLELEQRIASSSFLKYFIYRIPRKAIPDELVLTQIKNWNELEKEKLPSAIKKVFENFKTGKNLIKLFSKLIRFLEKIETNTAKILIQCICKNAVIFSQTIYRGFDESELNRAEFLILKLLNEKIKKDEIQSCIEGIIENSTAVFLPVILVSDFPKSDFHRISENIDLSELRDLMSKRLKKHFIDEKRDVFKEEIAWSDILASWSSNWHSYDEKNKKIVNEYVMSVIDSQPKYLGLIINAWAKGPEHIPINLDKMAKYFDLAQIYNRLLIYKENSYSTDDEEKAVSIFIKNYKKKAKKIQKKE